MPVHIMQLDKRKVLRVLDVPGSHLRRLTRFGGNASLGAELSVAECKPVVTWYRGVAEVLLLSGGTGPSKC